MIQKLPGPSLSFRHLIRVKINHDLPAVTGKHSMRRFGSFELEAKLLCHLKRIPRASGTQSKSVFFLAVVENVFDEFVQAPNLARIP